MLAAPERTTLAAVRGSGIPIGNDEIEVACDLLWFVKTRAALPPDGEALWQRLQPMRHGDYGGQAATALSRPEAAAVIAAGRFTDPVSLGCGRGRLGQRLEEELDSRPTG